MSAFDISTDAKSANEQMMEFDTGLRMAHLLYVLADLNVADQMTKGPISVDRLAECVGADETALYRVLRAVASKGVFTEVEAGVFGLTPLGSTLRSDVDGSLRDVFLMQGHPVMVNAYANIGHTVRTGEPAFDYVYRTDIFSYLAEQPAISRMFSQAMGNIASRTQQRALGAYDLSMARRIVDVGGAYGHLVATILQRYPLAHGVVFDRPEVVVGAEQVLTIAGVLERAELVGGDYMDAVPPDGDTYILSHVLHQINDDDAVVLLRNIRDVIHPRGRVLLLDPVLPEGDTEHVGKFMDITMLALTRGRDRTEQETARLFCKAGFQHVKTIAPFAPSSVVVAAPA